MARAKPLNSNDPFFAAQRDAEVDRLELALEEERRQRLYTQKEVERLRQQKADYLKVMKDSGVGMPLPGSSQPVDNPEDAAGCSTNSCVIE